MKKFTHTHPTHAPLKTYLTLILFLSLCSLCSGWVMSKHMSTKTPYSPNLASFVKPPADCKPFHFQMVSRHGSRYPTKDNVESCLSLELDLAFVREYIKVDWLKNWTCPFKLHDQGQLSIPGASELYNLGKRFNDRFPTIFPDYQYNPVLFPIQTTYVPRVSMSGNVFGYAVFGEEEGHIGPLHYQPIYSFTESKGKDIHLRPFEACTKYVEDKGKLEYNEDKNKFKKLYFPKIAESLTKQIGAAPHYTVSEELVTLYWELCTTEYTIEQRSDHFCSFFSKEDFETIETYYDIGAYYSKGYGWKLSYELACPLVEDIVNVFENKINGSDITYAFMRFGHAETILPLIARMGLYEDDFALKWNTPLEKLESRKWRTSVLSTFSANLAFILYHCDDGYKVQTLLNEGHITFEKCNNQSFCPFEDFKKMLGFTENCNFTGICEIKETCIDDGKHPTDNNNNTKDIILISIIFGISLIFIIIGLVTFFKCSERRYSNIERL